MCSSDLRPGVPPRPGAAGPPAGPAVRPARDQPTPLFSLHDLQSLLLPGETLRIRNAATDVYNFGPTNYYQRPDDRYVLGAFAEYEVNDWATAYADVMFMDDSSTFQIAPGGIFAGTFSINCANPLMSAQQKALLVPTAASGGGTCATNPNGTFTGTISRRNIEGGGRQGRIF